MATPPIKKSTSSDYIQTAIRIPRSLHSDIKATASRNGAPMKIEIIARLQATPINERIDRLERDISDIKRMLKTLIDR